MAIKEGRCPNCGSLVQLDPSAEKGHCLFCDAVFDNKLAFEIARNPVGVEFPDEAQPKYEGPSLTPRSSSGTGNSIAPQAAAKKKQAAALKPDEETYISKMAVQPDITLPFKIHLMIAVILIALGLVFAGVTIPMALRRDRDRATILSQLPAVSPIPLQAESTAALRQQDNSYLMIAVGESVTPQQAVALFKVFCEKRAEVRGIDKSQFREVYGTSTLRVAHKDGGLLIDNPTQAGLDNGTAVRQIT